MKEKKLKLQKMAHLLNRSALSKLVSSATSLLVDTEDRILTNISLYHVVDRSLNYRPLLVTEIMAKNERNNFVNVEKRRTDLF